MNPLNIDLMMAERSEEIRRDMQRRRFLAQYDAQRLAARSAAMESALDRTGPPADSYRRANQNALYTKGGNRRGGGPVLPPAVNLGGRQQVREGSPLLFAAQIAKVAFVHVAILRPHAQRLGQGGRTAGEERAADGVALPRVSGREF
jgi:hypothetical protein